MVIAVKDGLPERVIRGVEVEHDLALVTSDENTGSARRPAQVKATTATIGPETLRPDPRPTLPPRVEPALHDKFPHLCSKSSLLFPNLCQKSLNVSPFLLVSSFFDVD
jgi:hypothetical protein